jgi:hypothetical protein
MSSSLHHDCLIHYLKWIKFRRLWRILYPLFFNSILKILSIVPIVSVAEPSYTKAYGLMQQLLPLLWPVYITHPSHNSLSIFNYLCCSWSKLGYQKHIQTFMIWKCSYLFQINGVSHACTEFSCFRNKYHYFYFSSYNWSCLEAYDIIPNWHQYIFDSLFRHITMCLKINICIWLFLHRCRNWLSLQFLKFFHMSIHSIECLTFLKRCKRSKWFLESFHKSWIPSC